MRVLELVTTVDFHVETRADGTRVVRQGAVVTSCIDDSEADGGDGDVEWFHRIHAIHSGKVEIARLDFEERSAAESYLRDRSSESSSEKNDPAVLRLAVEHGRATARARRGQQQTLN